MHSDIRRTDKSTSDKTFQTRDKILGQKPPRTIEREFVQGAFVRVFCTRPTKNLGGPRCVTYFFGGVPGCVTGEGSKLAKNSVTYFMDGPIRLHMTWAHSLHTCILGCIKVIKPPYL